MTETSENQITTDDLAFSAFLRLRGYPLIKLDRNGSKSIFIFQIDEDQDESLKMEFVNSAFLSFYNELRNLKKLF